MVELLTRYQWPETRNMITLTLFILRGNLTQNSRFYIDKRVKEAVVSKVCGENKFNFYRKRSD